LKSRSALIHKGSTRLVPVLHLNSFLVKVMTETYEKFLRL
jgi:hypothetical protein